MDVTGQEKVAKALTCTGFTVEPFFKEKLGANEFDHRSGNKKAADLASQFLEDVTAPISIKSLHRTLHLTTFL